MESITEKAPDSRAMVWVSRIMSIIAVLFMLFDSVTKIIQSEYVMKATSQLGYPEGAIRVIGFILMICIILYLIPQTSIFGAVMLTGFLGGAVASNFRISNPLFSNTLFPVYIAILVWGGLFLREPRLRALFPFRKKKHII